MNVNVAPEPALAGAAAPFQVERLGVKLGAEISGVDNSENHCRRPRCTPSKPR